MMIPCSQSKTAHLSNEVNKDIMNGKQFIAVDLF